MDKETRHERQRLMGARLVALRNYYKLTQEQMAQNFGVGATTLQGWECGRNQIDATLLASCAMKMGFTTDWVLLGVVGSMPYAMAQELQHRAKMALDAPQGEKRGRGRPRKSASIGPNLLAG
jgi:transcriptional regulator with XRE-family HTH domain